MGMESATCQPTGAPSLQLGAERRPLGQHGPSLPADAAQRHRISGDWGLRNISASLIIVIPNQKSVTAGVKQIYT